VRISFRTFGCRLNQAETAAFERAFAAAGWQVAPFGEPADVAVIHGCAVTRPAELECLRLARGLKRRAAGRGDPAPWVVLVGCVVEAGGGPVPGVDLLVARKDKARLPEILARLAGQTSPDRPTGRPPPVRRVRALLKVQDGCDFFCSYCIVPHLRGPPVSRPWQVVLDEARTLAAAGATELVVTGCNLACYRDGTRGLADLVAAICALDEVGRVRLGSIEPATGEREIVDLMGACPKLCRHLHLPLQSGDAAVLRAMGRRYTPESFAATVCDAAGRVPGLGLGTDAIVGFPDETEAAFGNTRRLLAALPFGNLHVFPYSERPGTRAAELPGRVAPAVRKARAASLLALREAKRQSFALEFVGREVDVLVERADRHGGRGWTGAYVECRVAGGRQEDVGRILRVRPESAENGVLQAAK
jgi:threonylcarbamoyladenosine tRNA methylthiotransferase MtaB